MDEHCDHCGAGARTWSSIACYAPSIERMTFEAECHLLGGPLPDLSGEATAKWVVQQAKALVTEHLKEFPREGDETEISGDE